MSWKDEIDRNWGVGSCVHVYPDAVVVEGHKGLLCYSPQYIKIKRKKGCVAIEGERLTACEIGRDEVKIEGKIAKVEWL